MRHTSIIPSLSGIRIIPRHNVNAGLAELKACLQMMKTYTPSPMGRSSSPTGPVDAPEIRRFEKAFATFHSGGTTDTHDAVCTGSGRAALALALEALKLEPGSEVGVPAYCFYTLPAVIKALGLVPRYIPCDPETYTLQEESLRTSARGLAALVVIHPFGQTAPMDTIEAVCRELGLPLLEDPSQSLGARYRGKRVGSFGIASASSLVSGKNMTACGGGILLTRRPEIATHARQRMAHSEAPSHPWQPIRETALECLLTTRVGYSVGVFPALWALNIWDRARLEALFEEEELPYNAHAPLRGMSPPQAAIAHVQLQRLDALNARRRSNALLLLDLLRSLPIARATIGTPRVQLPRVVSHCEPTFNAVPIRTQNARKLAQQLLLRGIDSRADYMRWYQGDQVRKDEVLYLPNHPRTTEQDFHYMAQTLNTILS